MEHTTTGLRADGGKTERVFGRRCGRAVAGWGLAALLAGWGVGCDRAIDDATGAKTADEPATPGIVRLKPEIAAQAGVEVRPVVRGTFRRYRDFPGIVRPNENNLAEITALVRGRASEVYADLGQEVRAGMLLAILDSSELGMAQSSHLKAKAKLDLAEQAFERAKLLLEEKVIGRSEFQRRQGDLISARADAREARDRLHLLGMDEKEIKRIEREETIRSYVPIHAPFAGRIIARSLTRGEVVDTTSTLFVVADLSHVWVIATIPEKDIPYVLRSANRDRQVEVLVATYPNEVLHGTVTYVGDVLDPATRTMQVRVEVPNPEGRLKPEMFASVRIHADPEPETLLVPSAATLRDEGETIVFVQLDPQQFARRAVTLDGGGGDTVKALDGLREGEAVVVRGGFLLKSELVKQRQDGHTE
jgi:membrane fusion protein, heavy metal efflux system